MTRHNVSRGKTSRPEVLRKYYYFCNSEEKEFQAGQKFRFCNKSMSVESQTNRSLLFPLMALIPKYKTVPQQYLNPSSAIRNAETK